MLSSRSSDSKPIWSSSHCPLVHSSCPFVYRRSLTSWKEADVRRLLGGGGKGGDGGGEPTLRVSSEDVSEGQLETEVPRRRQGARLCPRSRSRRQPAWFFKTRSSRAPPRMPSRLTSHLRARQQPRGCQLSPSHPEHRPYFYTLLFCTLFI